MVVMTNKGLSSMQSGSAASQPQECLLGEVYIHTHTHTNIYGCLSLCTLLGDKLLMGFHGHHFTSLCGLWLITSHPICYMYYVW